MKAKELFKNFLQENGAFEQFCENLKNTNGEGMGVTFDAFFENRTTAFDTLIAVAFYWIDTKQGVLYWDKLDMEWKKLLRANMENLEN